MTGQAGVAVRVLATRVVDAVMHRGRSLKAELTNTLLGIEDVRDRALVQACVAVARAFRAETLAEYVDSERVADCLRGLGVDWMQGYLVSKPLPIGEALRDDGA